MITVTPEMVEAGCAATDALIHPDEMRAAITAALAASKEGEPDYCYDPDNWEWTQAWEDRAILIDGFGIFDLREPKLISTLINGPDKWVMAISASDDEWEIRWFDSEEAARAALPASPSVSGQESD